LNIESNTKMRKTISLLLTTLLIVCTIVGSAQEKKDITLENIWKLGTFNPGGVYGFVHLKDGKSYCRLVGDRSGQFVVSYSYETGNAIDTLINGRILASNNPKSDFAIESFEFSEDEQKAVIISASEQIYRHSSLSKVWVYDRSTQKLISVADKMVMYPTLSPNGKKVAYVHENNLYVKDLIKGKTKKVTKDGKKNAIINGAVDWVYEEEFTMSRGFEWNVDGTRLAYYKFNETAVKQWDMEIYNDLYPEQYQYKYPKAGEANSIVDVYVCDVKKGKSKKLETGSQNDQYLPRIAWSKKPELLIIQRLNRLQNHWEMLTVDAKTGVIKVALDETSETYVEVPEVFYFMEDGEHMIISSERDGYRQLYMHKVKGPQVFQITKGNFDVSELVGVDEKTKMVYFLSHEQDPSEINLFKIGIEGKNKTLVLKEKGTHTVDFSKDFSFMLHSFSTINTPPVYSIANTSGDVVRVLADNKRVLDSMANYNFSLAEFGKLTTSENIDLNYWMIKPANFDATKKYPVLMYVYGGPGSQTVKNSWGYSNYIWYQMLANKYGYIVISVDNRGTGARGVAFKKVTYKELGKYEIMDQIESAKWLAKQPYVDAARIGIWGWSYGGYMSSLGITKGNDVFKTAIAVAPVTNWRYYDNIYTERYMQTPQMNTSGYDNNSPINFVDQLKGNYLLIHGSGDDNVHFQNTVEMVNKMIEKNVTFDSEFYPNRNHGIYGGNTRFHLYNRMTKFILEKL
jgi:dipeptidyl-peptidase-4